MTEPRRDEDDGGRTEAQIAGVQGVGRYRRHILLCIGPDCCSSEQGLETWTYLKRRLKELVASGHSPQYDVFRSKVGCLRICRGGPIMIVYPDGTWYRQVTPKVCERILMEHVVDGNVVEDYVFADNPIGLRPA
ncbi:hypothetical protein OAX78_03340 [Planctomycetota bacterium]|nr:hypothetical protein [Planctomycetota bacterium]